jgi:hypothetical protein
MNAPKLVGGGNNFGPYPGTPEQDGEALRIKRSERAAAELQDLTDLRSMAGKAIRGVYGETAKGVAIEWARFNNIPTDRVDIVPAEPLRDLRKLLRKVPDRISG